MTIGGGGAYNSTDPTDFTRKPDDMQSKVGIIETVAIRTVWPKEDANFTPWLRDHIGELDKVLGLDLGNPQCEVRVGSFSVDLVAETNVGDVVIENQFGKSDHRHLGQLVTYLSHRDVEQAIWVVEEGRPEHVKAVQRLNESGMAQIWMVTVRTVRIGDSAAAPLFTIVAEPPEIPPPKPPNGDGPTPSQIKKREFMDRLFAQARAERIDSPFRNLAPSIHGILHTPAQGPGLVYRLAVNRTGSRVVVTNKRGRWLGVFDELAKHRTDIDHAITAAGLANTLVWSQQVIEGRWAIRYTVEVNWQEKTDSTKMRELNRASAEMKRVFDPYLENLDPRLEDDSTELPRDVDGNG